MVDATAEKQSLTDVVLILDDAPFHNRLEIRELMEKTESKEAMVLSLGPYSTSLSSIELF